MTKVKHVMCDTETLGQKPGCVVFAIGACFFTMDKTKIGRQDSFYMKLPILEQVGAGLVIEKDTASWWNKQKDDKAKKQIKEALFCKHTVGQALLKFNAFLERGTKESEIWACSPAFDILILEKVYAAFGIKPSFPHFRNERDVRTIREFFGVKYSEVEGIDNTVKHHALVDAKNQALLVQEAYEILQCAKEIVSERKKKENATPN